ncbi:MAG TPA: T9SS type A sorting domain-containing protein [Bacteroidales bacterium]|nr:T9SS type A sorting domain-containing protein [Bacteroidales bacterium]
MKKIFLTAAILPLTIMVLSQGLQISGYLRIESDAILTANANIEIAEGTITVEEGSTLMLGNEKTLAVKNGGSLYLFGDESEPATVTSHDGYFNFFIHPGGTIGASHAIFEKMRFDGLYFMEGSGIDPEHPLNDCIFQNGIPGGVLMTIDNDQIITINGATFNRIDEEQLTNVVKNTDGGKLTFTNYDGNFAGEEFELDPHGRVHWIAWIPLHRLMEDIVIENGQDTCFDAIKSITVAGSGTTFTVQAGGSAQFIAREKILLLYGTLVEPNAYLHAFITSDDSYCDHSYFKNYQSILAVIRDDNLSENPGNLIETSQLRFSLYPNPTSGKLTLKFLQSYDSPITVVVYNLLGKKMFRQEISGSARKTFDLATFQPGLYLVRITIENRTSVHKIIKN